MLQNIATNLVGFERNVRDELTGIDELMASIRQKGLLQFPRVKKADGGRFIVKTGHRRVEACRRLGMKEIPCFVVEGDGDDTLEQIIENLQRVDLHWGETGRALVHAQKLTGLTGAKLAEAIGKSEGTISKHLAVQTLGPEVLASLEQAGVAFSAAYAIATASSDKQPALLVAALGGASRDAIAGAAKRPRQPKGKTASRVRCPLTTGYTVTVEGEGMDTDALIEALEGVLGPARKARTQGVEVTTLGRMFRDMARG